MNSTLEQEIISEALERGLLRAEDLETAGGRSELLRWLVMTGRLEVTALDSLVREITNRRTAAEVETPRDADTLPIATFPASPILQNGAPPGRPLPGRPSGERYRLLELMGAGAMGRVYKARDLQLARYVAIKIMRSDTSRGGSLDYLQEARAQAQVEHPNVCKVYDVGERNGESYIAMQFIDGPALGQARQQLTLEQKARIVRLVAEALHAAHRQGLIHRDVKPANIHLERASTGHWHPYVLDFGLARKVDTSGLPVDGHVEGTPHFMAPEQARGQIHRLDRRTDVWGLGAVLYFLLCGQTPFSHESQRQLLVEIITTEPRKLREVAPSVPHDLEAICMKCLEKDPADRYPSASALAEDLQRYLDGEPVLALEAGLRYRLMKKARRHKGLVVVSAVALLLTFFAAGAALQARWQARRQVMTIQQLEQQIHKIENLMERAYLLPEHDISREKHLVRERMTEISEIMDRSGPIGRGPGAYALGRGHLALGEPGKARAQLRKAWDLGYRPPEVSHALGRALGVLYHRELRRAEQMTSEDVRESRLQEIERTLRDPALEHLRQGQGATYESARYVEALIALYEERYDEALEQAQSALAETPWLYRAARIEGEVYQAEGDERRRKGEYEAAVAFYDGAAASYAKAVEIGRSDPAGYEGLCSLAHAQMELELYGRGGDVRQHFERGLAGCQGALRIDPEQGHVYRLLSSLYFRLGEQERREGRDPRERFELSFQAARRALAQDPDDAYAHLNLGLAYRIQALYEMEAGLDPTGSAESALEAFQHAIGLNPNLVLAYNNLGVTYNLLANYTLKQGADPSLYADRAGVAFRKTASLDPGYTYCYSNLAFALNVRSQYELAHGLDPAEGVEQAVAACRSALAINPKYKFPMKNQAAALILGARHLLRTGGDPRPPLQEAVEVSEAALQISPRFGSASDVLGDAHLTLGEYELLLGHDPRERIDRAQRAYDQALEINPKSSTTFVRKAQSAWVRARFERQAGRDPRSFVEQGLIWAEQALELTANDGSGFLATARLNLQEARWSLSTGQTPAPALEASDRSLERALELLPAEAEVFLTRAESHLLHARSQAQQGEPFTERVSFGLDAAAQALRLNPTLAEVRLLEAELRLLEARAAKDERRAEALRQARATLAKALDGNANLEHFSRSLRDEADRLETP